jgi:hypothetical protein
MKQLSIEKLSFALCIRDARFKVFRSTENSTECVVYHPAILERERSYPLSCWDSKHFDARQLSPLLRRFNLSAEHAEAFIRECESD